MCNHFPAITSVCDFHHTISICLKSRVWFLQKSSQHLCRREIISFLLCRFPVIYHIKSQYRLAEEHSFYQRRIRASCTMPMYVKEQWLLNTFKVFTSYIGDNKWMFPYLAYFSNRDFPYGLLFQFPTKNSSLPEALKASNITCTLFSGSIRHREKSN